MPTPLGESLKSCSVCLSSLSFLSWMCLCHKSPGSRFLFPPLATARESITIYVWVRLMTASQKVEVAGLLLHYSSLKRCHQRPKSRWDDTSVDLIWVNTQLLKHACDSDRPSANLANTGSWPSEGWSNRDGGGGKRWDRLSLWLFLISCHHYVCIPCPGPGPDVYPWL